MLRLQRRISLTNALEKFPMGPDGNAVLPQVEPIEPAEPFDRTHGRSSSRSLALAAREDFFAMCEHVLWEGENAREFGEMLRSLVVEFMPVTSMHLYFLSLVAAAMWKLRRFSKTQKNLATYGSKAPSMTGLPKGIDDAHRLNTRTGPMLEELKKAISVYEKSISRWEEDYRRRL